MKRGRPRKEPTLPKRYPCFLSCGRMVTDATENGTPPLYCRTCRRQRQRPSLAGRQG